MTEIGTVERARRVLAFEASHDPHDPAHRCNRYAHIREPHITTIIGLNYVDHPSLEIEASLSAGPL